MKELKHGLLILASLLISQTLLAADGLVEVPFKLYRGYVIVVKGSIAGLERLNFLIDTGAVPSVVDRRIAQSPRGGTPRPGSRPDSRRKAPCARARPCFHRGRDGRAR
jgi:hypothetical protein